MLLNLKSMFMIVNLRSILIVTLFVIIGCGKKDKLPDPPEPPVPEIIETDPVVLVKVKTPVNASILGYYAGIPARYSETTKKYPLLVFLHGLGQRGDGNTQLDLLADAGLGRLISLKGLPPNFVVNGKNFSFIYVCPQFANTQPTPEQVLNLIDTIKVKYRIDPSRIYLSGLSVGGILISDAAAKYPTNFAAISPMAGCSALDLPVKCKSIANSKLPVWAFHNDNDPTIAPANSTVFVNAINSNAPVIPARLSIFTNQFGHDAWTRALDPVNKEDGKNVYEWMLQYTR